MKKRSIVTALLAGAASLSAVAQQSAVPFDAPKVEFSIYDRAAFLADVDGDGDQDVVGGWWLDTDFDSFRLLWKRNDGGGAFTYYGGSTFTPNGLDKDSPITYAHGYLNADNLMDGVVGLNSTLYKWEFGGNWLSPPTPTKIVEFALNRKIHGVAILDFDRDGKNDVAVVTDRVQIYRNVNFTTFTPVANWSPPTAQEFTGLAVTDVDDDGFPDLAASTGMGAYLLPVTAGGAFGASSFVMTNEMMPMNAFGDVDNDGDDDIVFFGMMHYELARQVAPGTYVVEPSVLGGPATDLADVDGDGDLDGICCGGGGGGPTSVANNTPSNFEISINQDGTFLPSFRLPSIGSVHIAGAADLDGDGDVDLVGGRCVYYARGPLTKDPMNYVGSGPQKPTSLVDVDGDGDLDAEPRVGSVYRNDGTGQMKLETLVPPALPAGESYAANGGYPVDYDGDGDADLVIEHLVNGVAVDMHRLANNGGGFYVDAGAATAGGVTFDSTSGVDLTDGAIAADADGDGDQDVFHYGFPGRTILWVSDGAGNFSLGAQWPFERVRFVVDMDLDGIVDVVTQQTNGVLDSGIRYGLGGGAFGPREDLSPWFSYPSFDVADLDGDGDPDFIGLPSLAGSLPFIHWNFGAKHYVSEEQILQAYSLSTTNIPDVRIQGVDVNGDGLADLVFSHAKLSVNASTVFLRKPDNTGYLSGQDYMIDVTTHADVDGDGDQDVIGARVSRGATFEMPHAGAMRQYGAASAGTGGTKPVFGASGPFRTGEDAELRICGGKAGGTCILVAGVTESALVNKPFAGMTVWCFPWALVVAFPLAGNAQEAGGGHLVLPYVVPDVVAGTTWYHQVLVTDPGAPHGLEVSNGLAITYGL